MRLFEVAQPYDHADVIEFYNTTIKPNCSQYIKEVGDRELYRGMTSSSPFGVFHTHPDRIPRNTPIIIANMLDDIMEKQTGIRIRSKNALFTTAHYGQADGYGNANFVIFVPGKLNYTFIDGIQDLYNVIHTSAYYFEFPESLHTTDKEFIAISRALTKGEKVKAEDIETVRKVIEYNLSHICKIHHNEGLSVAIRNLLEIVFTTPEYYAIQYSTWDLIKDKV
jgi:hypothetical protein